MNHINLIKTNEDTILNELREADKQAYRYTGCEYRVYVDTNSDVGTEEWAAGDNGWLQFREDGYDRVYVATLCHEYYSILWDYWFADSSDFAKCFTDRFGVSLQQEDGRSLDDDATATCYAHGIPLDDYQAWLADEETDAIDQVCGDADYYDFIVEAIRSEEMREEMEGF